MAWSVLQTCANAVASGNGTVGGAGWTSNLTAGSKIIVVVTVDASASPATACSAVKDAALNSWTQIVAGVSDGSTGALSLWALDTPAADAGTKPTLTATVSTNFGVSMIAIEVTGLAPGNTTAMRDGTAGTAQASTTGPCIPGAYSSTAPNEFLLAAAGDPGNSRTISNSAGYTATNVINASATADCFACYKNSTGGAESASMAITGVANPWFALIVAFKLAPPAGGGITQALPGKTWLRRFHHRQQLPLASPPGTVTLFGDGTSIAGAGATSALVTEIPFAAPAGAGTVTANVVQTATATLAGAGAVTAKVTEAVTAAPAGAGAVTAVVTEAATASLAGAGTVADVVTQIVTATLAGAGAVTAQASTTGPATAALVGAGVVTAVVTEAVIATPAGAGAVSTAVTQTATASLAGAGAVTAKATQIAPATLTGAGAVTDVVTEAVTASLTGAGSVVAIGSTPPSGNTSAIAGAGALSANVVQMATAALTGAGAVTAATTAGGTFTVGQLTAADQAAALLAARLAASALTAAGQPAAALTVTAAVLATLTAAADAAATGHGSSSDRPGSVLTAATTRTGGPGG